MDKKQVAKTVKDLIARNKTEEAIEYLAKAQLSEFDKDIIILNNRFNDITGEERLGVISNEQANREYNKINAALVDLALKLEKQPANSGLYGNTTNSSVTPTAPRTSSLKKKIPLISGGLILGFLALLFLIGGEEDGVSYGDEFIICVDAYPEKSEARNKVERLGRKGYNGQAGFIWIPDYDCLTGKELYQVYIGPFTDKEKLKNAICRYNSKFQTNTYAVKLCKEGHRETVRCD